MTGSHVTGGGLTDAGREYVKECQRLGILVDVSHISDEAFWQIMDIPEKPVIASHSNSRAVWDSSRNHVSDVAPGKSIGGDRFGNYEGLLPSKKGRTWYEADCHYTKGKRNAHRMLYSSDGLVYYTDDHYESFTQMHPSK